MTAQRAIRSYMLIAGLYTLSASMIWGVNTLFLLHGGLSISEVFLANAAFTAAMVVFDIPTGMFADTRGRRASFLLSVVVLFAGTLGYVGAAALGGGLLAFTIMSVVLGLGFCFYSGAVEAWLVDALHASNFEGELDRVFAKGQMVTGAAMLVGTVGGGLLGSLNLSYPFLARAGLLAILFGVAFATMHDIGFSRRRLALSALPKEVRAVAQASLAHGWKRRPVRLLLMVSFLQYGFLTWAYYAWQPYFLKLLGTQLVWVAGIISALIALSAIAGNALVEWFSRFCGHRTTLLLWAAGVQTAAAIGVGVARSFWLAVPLFLVVAGTMGLVGPVKQGFLHQLIDPAERATIVSFDSMFGNAGSVVGQIGLGHLSQVGSIAEGYVVGGAFTIVVLPVLALLRRLRAPADAIVGTGGRQGPCAGLGLPSVASIDATRGPAT